MSIVEDYLEEYDNNVKYSKIKQRKKIKVNKEYDKKLNVSKKNRKKYKE